MPRYTYKCLSCKEVFEVSHGMFFEQRRCIKCHSCDTLEKMPIFSVKTSNISEKPKKVGAIVDKFIEDSKKDLKKQKKQILEEHTKK